MPDAYERARRGAIRSRHVERAPSGGFKGHSLNGLLGSRAARAPVGKHFKTGPAAWSPTTCTVAIGAASTVVGDAVASNRSTKRAATLADKPEQFHSTCAAHVGVRCEY